MPVVPDGGRFVAHRRTAVTDSHEDADPAARVLDKRQAAGGPAVRRFTPTITMPSSTMASSHSEFRAPEISVGPRRRRAAAISAFVSWPAFVFALPYGLLLAWFHGVDVYHRHFSTPGLAILAYNGFRLLFVFYLFCMVAGAGVLVLRASARGGLDEIGPFERLGLGFFAGAGIWELALFALGYLNLYTLPVAVAVTVPMVVLTYQPMRDAAVEIVRSVTLRDLAGDASATPGLILLALVPLALALLFMVKGLYPGGGHDYFTHYFYYFQSVIAHHGLWPNEVWYHYYYDQGASLYFLGILLTDPLAPQLVTFTFIAAAALVIFLASRDAAPHTAWPVVAVLLFFAVYLYTPGWGEFEKTHELTAALMIGALWTGARALAQDGGRGRAPWLVATMLTITAAVLTTPTIAPVLGAIFALMFAYYLVARQFSRARLSFILAALVGALLAGTFAINYATTGLITDQAITWTWSFANLDRLNRWGALAEVIITYFDRAGMAAQSVPLRDVPKLLVQAARLDLTYPLNSTGFAVAICAAAFRLRHGRWAGPLPAPQLLGILLAALPVFVILALAGGRSQPVSFWRYASFVVPLVIVGGATFWGLPAAKPDTRIARLVREPLVPAIVFATCLFTTLHASHPARFFRTFLPSAARYAVGAISIDAAYSVQPWLPPTGIYAGARGAYAVVGPGTPIWSFHIHSYCMLPGCVLESYQSFIIPNWDTVMFGSPEDARGALQASGHNYFLFSRELRLVDVLPLSPLFAPDNIARYLGIRWTDGTTALLTWLGPGVQPLDQAWLADYRHAVEQSGTDNFPYAAMKQIFARLNATPHPWRPFPLPW